ncbi:AmmeMemoRadiSam system protein A [Nanoarchaeota archaeon]
MNESDKKALLILARDSISIFFIDKELEVSDEIKEKFSDKQGVFVTLNKNNELRGCIGFPEPVEKLYKAIIEAARSAAFHDPRFPAVVEDELKEIKIEMSVLTKPEMIEVEKPEEYLDKIKIGKDGLIIRSDYGSGLLLPQVFTEYNCDVEKALEMTCQKAGLDVDEWKNIDVKIYKFQADIFSE